MIIDFIICDKCGKAYRNVLTSTSKVFCERCNKFIENEGYILDPEDAATRTD